MSPPSIDDAYVDEVVAAMRRQQRKDWFERRLVDAPKRASHRFSSGLTEDELAAAETRFGVRFPPDLAAFLRIVVPVSRHKYVDWVLTQPDWRLPSDDDGMIDLIEGPINGIVFDIEHNGFWWNAWGPRPKEKLNALSLARRELAAAPTLIPLGRTTYLVGEPAEWGNPVFFLHQAEMHCRARSFTYSIWYDYGVEPPDAQGPLPDRNRDVHVLGRGVELEAARYVPFWTDLTRWNDRAVDEEPGPEATIEGHAWLPPWGAGEQRLKTRSRRGTPRARRSVR